MAETQFQTVNLGTIRVHVLPTSKFKTAAVVALIQQELTQEYVTKTALIPSVIQRATKSYPTTVELKRAQEDLYGAALFGDVFKRGERHIAMVGIDFANEQYLRKKEPILQKAISLLAEVLIHPVFSEAYVEAEKKILKQKLQSVQDDKIRYAAKRLIEVMCQGEPFALYAYGQIEDLDGIDAQNLQTYYQEMLYRCPIDFYCVGNVQADQVIEHLRKVLPDDLLRAERKTVQVREVANRVDQVKEHVERMEVTQGKLNMGLRTQVSIQDEQFPALLLYNGILGGFPHSKLFRNVREKASLAYYASSRLDAHKGLILIQSGIEVSNYEKAVQIIKDQLEAMRNGDFTQEELEKTKATLSNQLREQQDRSYEMVHFHYTSVLTGKKRSVADVLSQIAEVTPEQIRQVAQNIQLDTIYFLRDKGEDQHAKN